MRGACGVLALLVLLRAGAATSPARALAAAPVLRQQLLSAGAAATAGVRDGSGYSCSAVAQVWRSVRPDLDGSTLMLLKTQHVYRIQHWIAPHESQAHDATPDRTARRHAHATAE